MLIIVLCSQENISIQSQAFGNFTHDQTVNRNEIIRP